MENQNPHSTGYKPDVITNSDGGEQSLQNGELALTPKGIFKFQYDVSNKLTALKSVYIALASNVLSVNIHVLDLIQLIVKTTPTKKDDVAWNVVESFIEKGLGLLDFDHPIDDFPGSKISLNKEGILSVKLVLPTKASVLTPMVLKMDKGNIYTNFDLPHTLEAIIKASPTKKDDAFYALAKNILDMVFKLLSFRKKVVS